MSITPLNHDARAEYARRLQAQDAQVRHEQAQRQQNHAARMETLFRAINPAIVAADRAAHAAVVAALAELQEAEQALAQREHNLPTSSADDVAWAAQISQLRTVVEARSKRHATATAERARTAGVLIQALDAARREQLHAAEQALAQVRQEGAAEFQALWKQVAELQAKLRQQDFEAQAEAQAWAGLDVRRP